VRLGAARDHGLIGVDELNRADRVAVQLAKRRVADEVGVVGQAGQVEIEGVLDGLERLVVQAPVRVEEVEEVNLA